HWTPAFPAFYAAIAVPLGAWVGSWSALGARWRRLGPVLLTAGLLAGAVVNIDFYFNRYYIEPVIQLEVRAAQSRWEAALGPSYRVYTIGNGTQLYEPLTNAFLVHNQEGAALDEPASQLPLPEVPGKGLAFVFFADNDQYRPLIKQLYPGGTEGQILGHNGGHLFNTYLLTPEQVAAVPPRTSPQQQALLQAELPLRATLVREVAANPAWQEARGVAVLPDGGVVVGDTGHNQVLIYGPDGALLHSWGASGTGAGQFSFISDLAVAPDGTLAVLDANTGDIQLFTPDGQFVARLLGRASGVDVASGLSWAPDGSLYIANTSAGNVIHLGRDGQRLGVLHEGTAGRAAISQPVDVAVAADGSVYVADLSSRIVRFNPAGQMDAEWSAQVGSLLGGTHLTIWPGGLAMTNPDDNTLHFLSPGAITVRSLESGDAAQLHLATPVGIASGPDGRLYVLSSGDNRVVVLDAAH
ncbi:MAG TPA: NHL repeat-containing protein, partial [Chloroflexia bacterium]|nr:NHL repeat-containing protein [Chloroflexia bacterium]